MAKTEGRRETKRRYHNEETPEDKGGKEETAKERTHTENVLGKIKNRPWKTEEDGSRRGRLKLKWSSRVKRYLEEQRRRAESGTECQTIARADQTKLCFPHTARDKGE